MRREKEPTFESEAAMCAAFIDKALQPRRGQNETVWLAYAETAGFDILMVRRSDGFQIGIEAKLALNAKVLNQALEGEHRNTGPDCRAVLVPGYGHELAAIAGRCGITVITCRPATKHGGAIFSPSLPEEKDRWHSDRWYEQAPLKRCKLPDYIPDVAAGASAPLKLTDWKIRALKIEALLEKRGVVTRAEFKAVGIDVRRWLPAENGWLAVDRLGFIAGIGFPNFKKQHPKVYAEILQDFDAWAPKVDAAAELVKNGELL